MDATINAVLEVIPAVAIPVVALLWYFMQYFKNKYEKSEEEKSELAKDVIKLTMLFENQDKHAKILEMFEKLNQKINESHK
jgi:hypothetical protein